MSVDQAERIRKRHRLRIEYAVTALIVLLSLLLFGELFF